MFFIGICLKYKCMPCDSEVTGEQASGATGIEETIT
jgi:DNA-directed RNA polymerase subunit RPC12/RpoP